MAVETATLDERHRAEVERLLRGAAEEEERRSEGRVSAEQLLQRAGASLDEILRPAREEYAAFREAERDSAPSRLADRFAPRFLGGLAAAVVCAALATVLLVGSINDSAATAFTDGVLVAGAAVLGFVVQAFLAHLWSAERHAGSRHQPGGVDQLRLAWLTAVEVRGIRPYLEQQRAVAPRRGAIGGPRSGGARTSRTTRTTDRSARARSRSVLNRSFDRLADLERPFIGRRRQLGQIVQWVNRDRASTETRPTVVVLHGASGSGRTTLAGWAAQETRELFRGACLVDLRGQSQDPLPTRDAILHLMNRLGAPRDQLLFREGVGRAADAGQLGRLAERYQQHLTDLPVVIILDDATDAEQVCTLIPARSQSLVLVTAAEPLDISPSFPASVHQLPIEPLDDEAAEELLRASVTDGGRIAPGARDDESWRAVNELCAGRPILLRLVGSALDERSPTALAEDLAAWGPVGEGGIDPAERALRLRYADLEETTRRLLRRLALAGRASLGARAAAALLDVGQQEAAHQLELLAQAGLLSRTRGNRYRLHELIRRFARARMYDEDSDRQVSAAQERLIRSYAELADTVIRLVDGKTSTRADLLPAAAGGHGFTSLDAALRWLDDETSFITSTLRYADERVDRQAVQHLLGALCDYCLLRGDLYRLGELNELAEAVDQGLLTRSVRWRTGVAARQLGELDKARSTLTSVVSLYQQARHEAGTARALRDLGITLQHQGQLREAVEKLRQALDLQDGEHLAGDRAWTLHALAAAERECGRVLSARRLLAEALPLHQASGSVHGEAWTRFQLGQTLLWQGQIADGERELRLALDLYERSRDVRGVAWAMSQLGLARVYDGDDAAAVDQLRAALVRHQETEDARGEAWTLYYLGQAQEEAGDTTSAVRTLERARTMFNRMRDVYGLACTRHHSARVTRDSRAESTGSLRNSGFARQLLTDARRDFQRIGVGHGEAWSALELAVIEAGNERLGQALELTGEALALFTAGYGDDAPDQRGRDWAQFLRCTLLPLASPGGSEVGTAVAQEELAELLRDDHPARDPRLTDAAHSFALMLEREQGPEAGWPAWRLGMVPRRAARDIVGALPAREESRP
ncbi:tetratricopeptide repeat protein [Streptomyces sp. 3MP-14]|uniref:Tetratricopeptide repeat protein n=1 Tax=Streptomyces mimosae TaxID=2586635 RepID=A0A5N6A8S2_9ACTN|nr:MULTISPECIES: tetratricopeptide repeat protein [Streptomyces]KAB8165214.1 tetratricopeptide repeat protein [Streptomyces mimosae]KAB8175846.1 tetratricopeptide repeat protein [Streptomyces sp. 3MP-14]